MSLSTCPLRAARLLPLAALLAGCASQRAATSEPAPDALLPTVAHLPGGPAAALPDSLAAHYQVLRPAGQHPWLRKCRGCTIVIGTGNHVLTASVGKVRAPLALGPAASVATAPGGTAIAQQGAGSSATATTTTTGPATPPLGTRVAELLLGPLGRAVGLLALGGGAWLALLVWRRRRARE